MHAYLESCTTSSLCSMKARRALRNPPPYGRTVRGSNVELMPSQQTTLQEPASGALPLQDNVPREGDEKALSGYTMHSVREILTAQHTHTEKALEN